jgi:hypothetical protein
MNIKLSNNIENYFIKSNNYFSMQSQDKFINYFFPNNLIVNINNTINNNEVFNTIIYDIQLDNNLHLICPNLFIFNHLKYLSIYFLFHKYSV